MTTILLADDHEVVRHGLKSLLEKEQDFKIIGEARSGTETIKLTEELKPDILVLDLMMEGTNSLDISRLVGKRSPQTSVVILSMYGDETYVIEALRAGAKGYILKTSPMDELVFAIREIVRGHRYLSSSLSEKAIDFYSRKARATTPGDLTTREREILQLTAQGYTAKKVAELWGISPRTVESHRASLMRKLDVHTQKALRYYAFEYGMLPSLAPQKGRRGKKKPVPEIKRGKEKINP